jgi:hypothetical protein
MIICVHFFEELYSNFEELYVLLFEIELIPRISVDENFQRIVFINYRNSSIDNWTFLA